MLTALSYHPGQRCTHFEFSGTRCGSKSTVFISYGHQKASKMVSEEKKAELLMDHYKDSFQLTVEHWKTRNRLFIFVLITLTLMLFQLTSPNVMEQAANKYLLKQIEDTAASESAKTGASGQASDSGASTQPPNSTITAAQAERRDLVDFRFITSLLWFVLAYLLVQYYQSSILVDRQYIYLQRVESQFDSLVGPKVIYREGAFYLENRPRYLKHVSYLYQAVFLTLLAIVVVAKIFQEWKATCGEWSTLSSGRQLAASIYSLIDTGILLVIGYYTYLYCRWLKKNS